MANLICIAIVSALAGVIFVINANHFLRRCSMSDAEREIEDDELRKITDEGW